MENLRRWQLDTTAPYMLCLAADARLSRTNYLDDQVWELLPGSQGSPALALQTRYGGRVGLASLVPMWGHEARSIHQAQTYSTPPTITRFAPGFLQAQAALTRTLKLKAEYWVMESQAVGARYTVHNTGDYDEELQLDLFAHIASRRRQQPMSILTLADGSHALSLGRLPALEPVAVLEEARAVIVPGRKSSPKIGQTLTVPAGGAVTVRWVHAGLARMSESLERAQFWLAQDWDAAFALIDRAAMATPDIETGRDDLDAVIAFSYQALLQSFLKPTEHLPNSSFVATRRTDQGYSSRGDGTDHRRGWNGQSPQLTYLVAGAVASITPELAKGVIRNYLAVQQPDGGIDAEPGLGGQKAGMLCPPLLARTAWHIYQQTDDRLFINEVFARLLDFFNHWFSVDESSDATIFPEWQDERQTGYLFWPTFAAGQAWAQGVNIQRVESPDLAAYLISEAEALRDMARVLEDPGAYELDNRIRELHHFLDAMVFEGRYAYQDRETGTTSRGMALVENAPGDQEQILAMDVTSPSRLLIRVKGGTGKSPRATLTLEGIDENGAKQREAVPMEQFAWRYGAGMFTSQHTYATVDRVQFDGLSRVFRFDVSTIDLTRLDINAVMPLLSRTLASEQAESLVQLIGEVEYFLRESGLTIVSAQDPAFDPSSARGGGGTWTYWTTLIGEGLLDHGQGERATELVRRLLDIQAVVLRREKQFSEFYHSDEAQGLGEGGHLAGIAPLHLLMRLFGVSITDARTVWAGGAFAWGEGVTIRQHGVTVTRSGQMTKIIFPSGHSHTLDAGATWQQVVDQTDDAAEAPPRQAPVMPPEMRSSEPKRVIIEIERDDTEI